MECPSFCADGTPNTQINKVVCHPTLPVIVTGHEDKYIRFYDANTGTHIHVVLYVAYVYSILRLMDCLERNSYCNAVTPQAKPYTL